LGYRAATKSRLCCSRLAAQFFEQLRFDQHKVLGLVVTDLLNKQIADKLGTCETTLKIHRSQVMRKCEPDR
jgi:FixJ family two-component response regulator